MGTFSLRLFLLVIALVSSASCTSVRNLIPFWKEEPKPHVVIAFQDRAPQMIVLIKDLDLPVYVQSRDSMPFTQNSHALLLVGHTFPYTKLGEILEFARNYYTDLHYVQLTDPLDRKTPAAEHARLFIGATTDDAVKDQLVAWTSADFEKLRRVKSQEEMVQMIKAKSGPAKK